MMVPDAFAQSMRCDPPDVPVVPSAWCFSVSGAAYESDSVYAGVSSIMVMEIIVDDPDISDITVVQTEPVVYVDGNLINMIQATDGKWYAYIADTSGVKWADSTVTTPGIGFDYGEFCSSGTDSSELGMDLTGLSGVAIARPYVGTSSSTNGEATFQACSGGSVSSGPVLNNVVRNPPTPVSGAVPTGQIGIADNIFPVIQLMEFYSDNLVEYKGKSINFEHEYNDQQQLGSHSCTATSQYSMTAAMGDEWCVEIFASQLNIDPTSKDIWTFTVVDEMSNTDSEVYYRLFDSSGNAEADGNNPTDLNPFFGTGWDGYVLGWEDKATIKINSGCISTACIQPMSNQFQSLDASGNSASLSSTQQFITVIETENNSAVFTTLDSNGDASISTRIQPTDFYSMHLFGFPNIGSSNFELYTRPPAILPQTFTVQEDTMAVIPISFNNDLFADANAIIGSDNHAAYMWVWLTADATRSDYWDQYFSSFGDEAGFISEHYELYGMDIGDQINGQNIHHYIDGEYAFVYIPLQDFTGTDEFSIYLQTINAYGGFEGDSTTITVNVTPVNDAPITGNPPPFSGGFGAQMEEDDGAVNITLIGSDLDGDTISYIIVEQPSHGTLAGTVPNLTYTPNANYNGADSFQYKVNDGLLDGSTETVSISISPVNDIPVAQAGSDQSVDPGSIVQLDGSQSSDVDGDTITYSWIQTAGYPVTLTADNIASPQFTAPSQGSQLTFMLTLNDGIATSSPSVVNIYVGGAIPDPTPPPAPGSVASSASNSQVTLTWSAPSYDGGAAITDYLVEYATADSGTWLAYNDGTSTATSATITGLSNGQEYNFRISAVNSVGIGDASGSIDATPSVEPEVEPEVEPVEPEVEPVEPEIIPEEPEPVMEIEPDAEPETTSEAVPAFEPEPKSEAAQSSAGCGAGTVMVNGVCQLAKTSGTSMAIEPMYIVIAAVAIGGGAVGALFALKRGSGTPKPAREELEEYESKYVARKPAEKKETSSSCSNCGNTLKPTAKFCGKCGTPVS